jgi:GlpG protein
MRQIGLLESESAARTFSDFLYVQGIENQVEPEHGHGWGVWVNAEDQLTHAQEWLAAFIRNPSDPRFKDEARTGAKLRLLVEEEQAAYVKKIAASNWSLRMMAEYGLGPLTVGLMVISVVVFLLSRFGTDPIRTVPELFMVGFAAIRDGQVWRLLTPIFIHYGFLHIFFNLLWLRDLGSMIEARQGSLRLASLVVVIGIVSNVAQYIVSGPLFGGLSGVVYGLIGYIWMRGKRDPASGLFLHPSTVTMAAIWFFACLIGLVPHVANTAHAIGAGVGILWGYLSSLRRR